MTAPWWAVLGTSQLHSTLSRQKAGPPVGLHLSKPLLFVPRHCDASLFPLPPEVHVTRAGFCLLGCPIGPPSFCEQVLQGRVVEIREGLGVLLEMGDAQMETTLLRSCFALPKFSYLLCTCPPTHISKATMDFDVAMREALESILGGPLSGWSWLKASLPSSRGGVNLRSVSLHAPAAFLTLPVIGWDNAWGCTWSLHPYKHHDGCPLFSCIPTRLAMFGGHRCASAPALSLAHHRRRFTPATPLFGTLHPCQHFSPLIRTAPCRRLAQWSTISCLGSPHPRPGVPLLPAVLVGSSTPQHLLLLPRMPQHSGPLWRPPGWLWGKWG